jgi:hypothetical protein
MVYSCHCDRYTGNLLLANTVVCSNHDEIFKSSPTEKENKVREKFISHLIQKISEIQLKTLGPLSGEKAILNISLKIIEIYVYICIYICIYIYTI